MILARAPLRIPLGGGGTDFPSYYKKFGGMVLGFALDRYVHCIIHDTVDNKVRLKYSKTECVNHVDQLENRVAAEALKFHGITTGIEVATFSDVPESSGLGGSSAFCVALVTAIRHKLGIPYDKYEIYASAYDIERNKAGQPGGLQDQFFAAFGSSWMVDLPKHNCFSMTNVDVKSLVPRLKLVYTGTGRSDLGIAVKQNEMSEEVIQSLHVTREIGTTVYNCLIEDRLDDIGDIFHKHWENKKKRSPDISNSVVDGLYESLRGCGVRGGKLLGLGGGGYLLIYANGVKFDQDYRLIDVGIDQEGCKVVYSNGK